jgi:anti-anti-sigma factor
MAAITADIEHEYPCLEERIMADTNAQTDSTSYELAVAAIPTIKDLQCLVQAEWTHRCMVIRLTGMVLQPFSDEFLRRTEEVLRAGAGRRAVLDLSTCSYVSSSVIAALVQLYSAIQEVEGQMVVVRPPERVERVLRAVGLDSFLMFVDSFAMAVTFFDQQGEKSAAAR